jgi:hypothetical protein
MPTALVLGCAECVWKDAEDAMKLFEPDAIFAVKDMIARWPGRIDYGICLHPERTAEYMRQREVNGLSTKFQVWAHKNTTPSFHHRVASDWAGSSGLFGVRVALLQGFDRVVLAGVPMEQEHRHIRRKELWTEAGFFHKGWIHRHDEIAPFVRSMSGWTKAMLGAPTQEWLNIELAQKVHDVDVKEKGDAQA